MPTGANSFLAIGSTFDGLNKHSGDDLCPVHNMALFSCPVYSQCRERFCLVVHQRTHLRHNVDVAVNCPVIWENALAIGGIHIGHDFSPARRFNNACQIRFSDRQFNFGFFPTAQIRSGSINKWPCLIIFGPVVVMTLSLARRNTARIRANNNRCENGFVI